MAPDRHEVNKAFSVWRQLAVVGVVSTMMGCVAVPQRSGFGDMQVAVNPRIGQRVHWDQGTQQDKSVRTAVQKMLKQNLSADEAVQIALLNNRQLQAT
jgi:cobalt-zinc-cadmium efflux system outer membrane protein